MKISGIEGMTADQLNFELQRGARFVMFHYTVSVIVLTFRRSSSIYFVKAGESAASKGAGFTVLTLLAGCWGIPWGPIYTVQSLATNFRGGKDVTKQVIAALSSSSSSGAKASTNPSV